MYILFIKASALMLFLLSITSRQMEEVKCYCQSKAYQPIRLPLHQGAPPSMRRLYCSENIRCAFVRYGFVCLLLVVLFATLIPLEQLDFVIFLNVIMKSRPGIFWYFAFLTLLFRIFLLRDTLRSFIAYKQGMCVLRCYKLPDKALYVNSGLWLHWGGQT